MNSFIKIILIAVLFVFVSPKSRAQESQNKINPLLVQGQVFPHDWSPGQGGKLEIQMSLPEGYHAYEDQFRVLILEPDGFKVGPLKISPIKKWFDKFSKKERTGFSDKAKLTTTIEAPNRFLKNHTKLVVEVTYQACADQYCLFPTKRALEIPISVTSHEGSTQIIQAQDVSTIKPTESSFFESQNFEKYLSSSLAASLLFVFLAGIFTSFTPCIFPMIPITLAVLGNHSNERTRLQNFITSVSYVLGIATTYSLLGLAAASSGVLFGSTLGNPYVLSVICLIFLTMAFSMYGAFELQVPAALRNRLGAAKSKKSLWGAYLTGLFAGIVASPCVGPVLVAILTYVASTQNKILGFLYLFTYALGLGLIFIVLGFSNQLLKLLPRSGPWMNGFKFILGTLMLSAFYYYLNLLLPVRWFDFALGCGLVIIGSIYGAFGPLKGHHNILWSSVRKGLMQATLVVGFVYLVFSIFDLRPYIHGRLTTSIEDVQTNSLKWQPYSEELLLKAAKEQKPVIIDFWAEWCAACHELAEHTFTDIRVKAAATDYILLKFDATKDSQELRDLKKKYSIQGLPTLLFFNKQGLWIDALTLTQFEKPELFVQRLEKGQQ